MIPIKEAKRIREELNLTHLVLFGIDKDGAHHICTHGGSFLQAKQAADYGNNLKRSLGWPERLCQSKPLPRICDNCSFFDDLHAPGCRNLDPTSGRCYHGPVSIVRNSHDIACNHFEPKN